MWSEDEDIDLRFWQEPFYTFDFPNASEQAQWPGFDTPSCATLRARLAAVTPETITDLLREPSAPARTTGAIYCGLKAWTDFVPLLGQLLVKNEFPSVAPSYAFALARCAAPASVPGLRGYLNQAIQRRKSAFAEVAAVLGALMWVDAHLGTEHADDYAELWRMQTKEATEDLDAHCVEWARARMWNTMQVAEALLGRS